MSADEITTLKARAEKAEADAYAWRLESAALRTQKEQAEAECDRLAGDALAALAGAGVATPQEGYIAAPFLLKGDIGRLAAERDAKELALVSFRKDAERGEALDEKRKAEIRDLETRLVKEWERVRELEAAVRVSESLLRVTTAERDEADAERDALRATVAEAVERLDEFGSQPTLADGIQAMRLRLVELRAQVAGLEGAAEGAAADLLRMADARNTWMDRAEKAEADARARAEDWNNERTMVVMERRRAKELEAERDALDKLRHDYKCALEKSDADLMMVRTERDALRAQVAAETNLYKASMAEASRAIEGLTAQVKAARAKTKEEEARRVELLLLTPCASEDYKEGVRQAAAKIRSERTFTTLDAMDVAAAEG